MKIIQTCILIAITAASLISGFTLREQIKFNQATLRPWLYPTIFKVQLSHDSAYYTYEISNAGHAPAFEVKNLAVFSISSAKFPVDTFRVHVVQTRGPTAAIYPSQTAPCRQTKSLPVNMSGLELAELAKKGKLYLHIYIHYRDPVGKQRAYRASFDLEYIGFSDGKSTFRANMLHTSTRIVQ